MAGTGSQYTQVHMAAVVAEIGYRARPYCIPALAGSQCILVETANVGFDDRNSMHQQTRQRYVVLLGFSAPAPRLAPGRC